MAADPTAPDHDQVSAGIPTFVGRVRGRLDAHDAAWVSSTSERIQALRDQLGEEHERLAALEARVAPGAADGPATAAEASRLLTLVVELRGEQLVDDLLSGGILPAPPAATGGVAIGPEGGWHLDLRAAGGGTVARADVVLTASPRAVRDRLTSHPTTTVVYTTTDAADGLVGDAGLRVLRPGEPWPAEADGVVVVDVGVGIDALDDDVAAVARALGADAPPRRATAEPLLDAVPLLGLALVGARAAIDAATTEEDASDIRDRAWSRTRELIASAGLSHVVTTVTGAALLRVPVSLSTGLSRAAVRDARADVERSRRRVARARRLLAESAPPTPGSPTPQIGAG